MGYGVKFFSRTQLKTIASDEVYSAEVRQLAELTLQAYGVHLSLEELLISQLPKKENA
jgi:hypothetical protein